MSTDAIVVLKDDHQQIRKLFRDFQAAGENATTTTKGKIATRIIEELTVHTYLENEVMYPEVRNGLGRTKLQEFGARMVELRKTAPRSPAQPSALKKVVDAVIA